MLTVSNLSGLGGIVSTAGGGGSPGGGVATLSYRDRDDSSSNLSSYTFTGLNIGTESASRRIVICYSGGTTSAGRTATVTVGGAACTATGVAGATDRSGIAITTDVYPTGTTATVNVTWNNTMERCMVAVYAVYDIASVTPTDTLSSTATDPTGTIDVPANGILIAIATTDTTGATVTWTGATEDFELVDSFFYDNTVSSASHTTSTEQLARTLTANFSAGTPSSMFAASWAP